MKTTKLLMATYIIFTTLCSLYLIIGTHVGNGLVGWPI